LPHKRQPGEVFDPYSRGQPVGEQGTPAHRTLSQANASRAQSLPPYAGRNLPSAEHTARHTPLNPRSTCAVRQRRRPTSLRSHPSAGQTVRIMGRCVEGVHRTQSTPPKLCVDGCVDESAKRPRSGGREDQLRGEAAFLSVRALRAGRRLSLPGAVAAASGPHMTRIAARARLRALFRSLRTCTWLHSKLALRLNPAR